MSSPLVKPQPKPQLPQQRPQPSQPRPQQKPQASQQPQKKPRLDFDSELIGRSVVIKLLDGSTVQGIVTDNSKFWLRVLCGERVIFVHKAAIVLVEAQSVKK